MVKKDKSVSLVMGIPQASDALPTCLPAAEFVTVEHTQTGQSAGKVIPTAQGIGELAFD